MPTARRPLKDSLPSTTEIFRYWKDRIHIEANWIDWGEPSCWACGLGWEGRYDIKTPNASWTSIERAWERAPLQRCHIVPKSLRGPDTVDNLFLMCRECHDLAPNTPIREIFFHWVKQQSWFRRSENTLKHELEAWRIPKNSYERIASDLKSKRFKAWAKNRIGLHRPQSGYSGLGKKLTPSTLIGLWWWWNKLKRSKS